MSDVSIPVHMKQAPTTPPKRQDRRNELYEVEEGGLKFLVNLFDFLDTGLFLDHRPLRARIRELAHGKRFLNLYPFPRPTLA